MADSVSEADISDGVDTGSKSSEQKKKERIRVLYSSSSGFTATYIIDVFLQQDNQRRSRARRQEHLADLEKRVAASHAACREAELQRGAFHDAQIENSRLRDLLRIAGVNDATVQSYVNQGINQAQSADSTHRTLRPRISTEHARQRSRDGGHESARTSPYPEVSAMRRLNFEPDSNSSSVAVAGAAHGTSNAPGCAHTASQYLSASFTAPR
jgi:hypothetical protein